jgi:hypothetical protein
MVDKKREKAMLVGISEVEEYLKASRSQSGKYKEIEKERERRTMERGMVYWINT